MRRPAATLHRLLPRTRPKRVTSREHSPGSCPSEASPLSQVGLQRPRRLPPLENLQIAQQHGSSPLPSLDRPHTLPHKQADLSSLVSQIENFSVGDDLWTRTGNLLNENRASVREVILDSLCRRHRAPGIAPLLELDHIVMRTCQLVDC